MKTYEEYMKKAHGALILERETDIILEIRATKDYLDSKIDVVDARVEQLVTKVDKLEGKVDRLETDVKDIKTTLNTMQDTLALVLAAVKKD